ncbi:MAG: hypothetical protein ABFD60_02520 [Bryobacteraceae bacterium]|jgi:hypothetical protein
MANINTPVRPPVPAREELARETAFIPAPDPKNLPAIELTVSDADIADALAAKDYTKATQLVGLRESLKNLQAERLAAERKHREQVQQLKAVEDELLRRGRIQDECLHIKENRRPAVVPMKDSSGNVHYLCQQCQKHWVNRLPAHLTAGLPPVGGPS